ncbi:hypothetical protein Ct61P_15464 [Colletotrichum tofieldiae]|nr:hypothetical protein Ct61P_15464 [Colletotrichum tofieldiae]
MKAFLVKYALDRQPIKTVDLKPLARHMNIEVGGLAYAEWLGISTKITSSLDHILKKHTDKDLTAYFDGERMKNGLRWPPRLRDEWTQGVSILVSTNAQVSWSENRCAAQPPFLALPERPLTPPFLALPERPLTPPVETPPTTSTSHARQDRECRERGHEPKELVR